MATIERMKELVGKLSIASKAYYQDNKEVMSNYDYDQMYDELLNLEKELGITLASSPTQKVGYELMSELPKERHDSRMLSLDKTKDRDALMTWIGEEEGLLSWKLDGITIVLTYVDGLLVKGVTRGNGEIGEVVTNNVKVFDNIPLKINDQGRTVIRGEAVIKFSDFMAINEGLEPEEQFKNPRNLCSGTVRQLNNEVIAKRHVNFYAFQLVSGGPHELVSKAEQLNWLTSMGFEVVAYKIVNKTTLLETIQFFSDQIEHNEVASDGLVLTYDHIGYADSLGTTSKFPKHSIAFKWQDEVKTTHLLEVEWSASRTGLINPVAIFEPVELEGTTVARASLHNISILRDLELGIGDEISVYKANMIIPQVADNLTRSGNLPLPKHCLVCGEATEIRSLKDVQVLMCNNPNCGAKHTKGFAHFVSRDAMNIDGLSEATLEKLIGKGLIHTLDDLYHLEQHKEAIEVMDGFGEKSYRNLIQSIETSKVVRMENFIYGLAIPNVGLSNAKLLCKFFGYDIQKILNADQETYLEIDGYGEVIAQSLWTYFNDVNRRTVIDRLLPLIDFEEAQGVTEEQVLEGLIFVITGSLETYDNRNAMAKHIEALGGKVTGTVTGKTDYLINNDVTSTSGKNKKAKDLGVPVISEEEFRTLIKEQ